MSRLIRDLDLSMDEESFVQKLAEEKDPLLEKSYGKVRLMLTVPWPREFTDNAQFKLLVALQRGKTELQLSSMSSAQLSEMTGLAEAYILQQIGPLIPDTVRRVGKKRFELAFRSDAPIWLTPSNRGRGRGQPGWLTSLEKELGAVGGSGSMVQLVAAEETRLRVLISVIDGQIAADEAHLEQLRATRQALVQLLPADAPAKS